MGVLHTTRTLQSLMPRFTQSIAGVVFDMDATLVDSRLDYVAMKTEMGLPLDQPVLESLAKISDPATTERCLTILARHEREAAETAWWIDGACELLEHLIGAGLSVGIVTRNSRVAAELTLGRLGSPVRDLLTRDDAPHKPDPAAIHILCSRWALPPARVVMVGDYLFDVQAGRNAGAGTLLFATEQTDDADRRLAVELADGVVTHLSQVREWVLE